MRRPGSRSLRDLLSPGLSFPIHLYHACERVGAGESAWTVSSASCCLLSLTEVSCLLLSLGGCRDPPALPHPCQIGPHLGLPSITTSVPGGPSPLLLKSGSNHLVLLAFQKTEKPPSPLGGPTAGPPALSWRWFLSLFLSAWASPGPGPGLPVGCSLATEFLL